MEHSQTNFYEFQNREYIDWILSDSFKDIDLSYNDKKDLISKFIFNNID